LKGLYTHTLFRFHAGLFRRTGPALELGRSFIRTDSQRDALSLPLLWKGIARYLVRHPRYRTLFGPVSISDDYVPFSKALIYKFLLEHHALARKRMRVRPRNPFPRPGRPAAFILEPAGEMVQDLDELSAWIAEIEPDGKGVPVLLRHYLKLGGRVAGFNTDQQFSNVVDALIFVDVPSIDPRTLARWMGVQESQSYLACHLQSHSLPRAS
jgi:putative hemolysin